MGGHLNPMLSHSALGTSFWFQRVIVSLLLTILTEGVEKWFRLARRCMSHLKNVLFVEYHSSDGEIRDSASFIY
jgi:hypothetical protein